MNPQLLKTKYLQIDLNKKRYRKMHRIFLFFRVGIWESLPDTRSVAITKIKMSSGVGGFWAMGYAGPSVKNTHETYCIFLRSRGSNIRAMEGELDEVKKIAAMVGEFLDKPVINHLDRVKKTNYFLERHS